MDDATRVQGSVSHDCFLQRAINVDVSDSLPRDDGSGVLCRAPGVFATDRRGNQIRDFLNGGQ